MKMLFSYKCVCILNELRVFLCILDEKEREMKRFQNNFGELEDLLRRMEDGASSSITKAKQTKIGTDGVQRSFNCTGGISYKKASKQAGLVSK